MNEKIILAFKQRKWIVGAALALILISIGGLVYIKLTSRPDGSIQVSNIQTTVARRGDLIISASGTGVLTDANEVNLAFTASGQVTAVFVKPGDIVQTGDILAQVASRDAQINYEKAMLNYQSLTSNAAIASAQAAVAQAETKLNSAKLQLEYLISPDVMYWETEIEQGQQKLKNAQEQIQQSPSDAVTQQNLKKAQGFLGFAQDQLTMAQKNYKKVYIPETFTISRHGIDTVYAPTNLEIAAARAAIDDAQEKLKQSEELYNVLTGNPMPDNPISSDVLALKQARLDFENAQAAYDGTKITAPFSGTVLAVNFSAGQTADTSTAIVLADMSKLYIKTYLDESDYDSFKVGDQATVTFDALPNQTFTGKVTDVDVSLDTSSGSSVVSGLVELNPTNTNLLIGMSATVEVISAEARNAVIVSVSALHKDVSGQYSVYLMENGKPLVRNVQVGLQDLVNAEIKSGLNPGDVVLIGEPNNG